MAVLAFPERAKRFQPRLRSWWESISRPARPVLANLAAIPLTVAGLGCADFAAFHLAHGWGWLITGASLMWLEHLIADEE